MILIYSTPCPKKNAPTLISSGFDKRGIIFIIFTARLVCIAEIKQDISVGKMSVRLFVRHVPVFCRINGYTYPQRFFTIGYHTILVFIARQHTDARY